MTPRDTPNHTGTPLEGPQPRFSIDQMRPVSIDVHVKGAFGLGWSFATGVICATCTIALLSFGIGRLFGALFA